LAVGRSAIGVAAAVVAGAVLVPAEPVRSEPAAPAIVFARGAELFAISFDGTRTVRLTRTRVGENAPAVSPDGSTIAFARGDGGISVLNVDGSGRRIVTRGPDGGPAWSPDGKSIYFVRDHPGYGGETCGAIFRIASTGGQAYQVTRSGLHSHLDPAVSPDGQRVAFTDWNYCSGGVASPRLRVVDVAGRPTGDLARLRRNDYWPGPEHSSPAWSPDGRHLAFLRNSDLTVAGRDGSGAHRVARGYGQLVYRAPAWSPDGSWIAFARYTGSFDTLVVVRPNGTGARRLVRNRRGSGSYSYTVGGWLPHLPD
jgi:Tol biopolymer transport system component